MATLPISEEIQSLVREVALLIGARDKASEVRRRAEGAARALGDVALRTLARAFGRPPEPPADFRPDQVPRRNLAWLQFWGEAIYAILYCAGERALPGLREVVFGADGPDPGLAFYALARLARDGIGRASFFDDVRRELPRMSSDAQVLLIDALILQGYIGLAPALGGTKDRDPSFTEELDRLRKIPAFRAAEREWDRHQG